MNFVSFLIIFIIQNLLIHHCGSANLPESNLNGLHVAEADCQFTVHEKGPNGKEVDSTSLNQELYYKIKCKSETGYCLMVSNCTVSVDSSEQKTEKPYQIIDEKGCTKEPSLFEHVQYEDDFTAGIYNPYPIRFRGQKSAVKFQCSTTLTPTNGDECHREPCVWNEYTREANQKSN